MGGKAITFWWEVEDTVEEAKLYFYPVRVSGWAWELNGRKTDWQEENTDII